MIRKSSGTDAERSALPSATPFNPASKKLTQRAALFTAPLFDSPFTPVIGFPISQVLEAGKPCESPIALSNATNSKSPNDMKSRIFIGNLNTNLLTKRQLHVIFSAYGEIAAMSMHKGFAFVQYKDEMDALNAVYAQDGRILAGQAIGMLSVSISFVTNLMVDVADVNLVTTPKSHQKSCKKVLQLQHFPAGDSSNSTAVFPSSSPLIRRGSSSSSASSCSARAASSDARSPDVVSERDESGAGGEAGSLRLPEIELSSPLPSSNPLASESLSETALLSQFPNDLDQGILSRRMPIGRCEEEGINTAQSVPLIGDLLLSNDGEIVSNASPCYPDSDQIRDSVSNINKNARVVKEMAKGEDASEERDAHESLRVNDVGSQDAESSETETSQVEQMIEEVGRDGEDLREEQDSGCRNTGADRLLAFPVSPTDISSSIRKTFCSETCSASDARLNVSSVSCKRPRLEIPHANRFTLPLPCVSIRPHHSPPQLCDTLPGMSSASTADLMICGVCKCLFTSLSLFVSHKQRNNCRLRFVCRCETTKSTDQ